MACPTCLLQNALPCSSSRSFVFSPTLATAWPCALPSQPAYRPCSAWPVPVFRRPVTESSPPATEHPLLPVAHCNDRLHQFFLNSWRLLALLQTRIIAHSRSHQPCDRDLRPARPSCFTLLVPGGDSLTVQARAGRESSFSVGRWISGRDARKVGRGCRKHIKRVVMGDRCAL